MVASLAFVEPVTTSEETSHGEISIEWGLMFSFRASLTGLLLLLFSAVPLICGAAISVASVDAVVDAPDTTASAGLLMLGILFNSMTFLARPLPPLLLGEVPLLLLLLLLLHTVVLLIAAGLLLRSRELFKLVLSLNGLLFLNSSASASDCWGELGTLTISVEFNPTSEVPELFEEVEMLWNGLVEVLLGVIGIGEDGWDMFRNGLLLATLSRGAGLAAREWEGTLIFSTIPPFCSEKWVTVTLSDGGAARPFISSRGL